MRDSFIFYRSFFESLNTLPKTARLKLLDGICNYALNGQEPNGLNVSLMAIFNIMKSQIDKAQKKYDSKVENGKRGGAPKGNKNAKKQSKTTENNLNQPNSTENNLNDNVYVYEDVDVDVDDDVNDNVQNCQPPQFSDILSYASELGLKNEEYCKRFYNYYGAVNWVNGAGQKITNWRLAFLNWCDRDNMLKNNDSEIDTETIYEDEFGRYRINENGKRVVC